MMILVVLLVNIFVGKYGKSYINNLQLIFIILLVNLMKFFYNSLLVTLSYSCIHLSEA